MAQVATGLGFIMLASLSIIPLIDLPFLATEVNDAHKQVTFHARSMLLEAKRAGDALIAAKGMVKHGEFKAWVETNCRCSYETANRYMRVSKLGKDVNLDTFDGGLVAFLEAHSTPRKVAPTPTAPTFDKAEAEYAIKLHRMAASDNPHEAVVASTKLDRFAKQFGMVGEEVVAKAEALLPDQHKSRGQQAADDANEKLRAAEERLAAMEDQIQRMLNRKEELRGELRKHSRDELIEMLADAYLQLEQP
ncbi:MAG: DUF3102 domain-containing protein [Devosia sp.]